jgi:glutathione synthase
MKIAFIVNDVATEDGEYTTTRLAMASAKLEHEVWYVGLGDMDYEPDEKLRARGHRATYEKKDDLATFLERAQDDEREGGIVLDEFDAVWLRSDSIEELHDRPWAMAMGVVFGQMLVSRGVTVVNDPAGLSRAVNKLYLQEFPASIRPRSLISRHPEEMQDFITRAGRAVMKPLYGAKGRNVFVILEPDDANLSQMIEATLEDGYAIVQEFVPGAEEGDLRLFLLDGEILEEDGQYAAVRRVPRGTDLRANISTGGKPEPAELGETEFAIARALKDQLVADGMFFVGIDIIGDKVVEINAESPGGLQSVEHFTGIDFGLTICEALERRVQAGSSTTTGI